MLKDYQTGIMLGQRFWIDETYLSKRTSDILKDEGGKKLRCLSRDKIYIATATDGTHSVLFPIGFRKPSSKRLAGAMEGHVTEKSTKVDDGKKAHISLMRKYNLKREMHPSDKTKGLSDDRNPMNTINILVHAPWSNKWGSVHKKASLSSSWFPLPLCVI